MTEATKITPELLCAMPLPQPAGSTDKQARGSVLVVAGSVEVPGAALLAGTAALRAGAGKLQIATCSSVALHMALAVPEARVTGLPETPEGGIAPEAAEILCERAKRNDAVLLGPGMMDKDEVASLLEIGRDAVEEDPLAIARQVATRFQVVVALKGGTTHIVDPDGDCWFYESGNVGLATSGSGDTLAGVVAGLVARGAGPAQATIWAVYLHGQAGNRLAQSRGPMGFLARELLAEIPGI